MPPLVSIVVTCYNRAGMVCKALDSVYAQTYRPLELVVVDDGSKDNSMEVILDWKTRHPDGNGFSCIARTFSNGKLCIARNRGLEMSHGEWIQYVDDDDWLYPDCVTRKMEMIVKNPSRDIVVHQVELINRFGTSIGHSNLTLAKKDEKQLLHLLNTGTETLFSPTLMFRRKTLEEVGRWTPGLVFADDVDVVFRSAIGGAHFGIVDEALSAYNMHDADRQCNKVIYQLEDDFWSKLFRSLSKFAEMHGRNDATIKDALAKQLVFYADRQARWGRYRSAICCYREAADIAAIPGLKSRLPSWILYPMMFAWHSKYIMKSKIKNMVHYIMNAKKSTQGNKTQGVVR